MLGFKPKQDQTDLEEQIAEVHRQMFATPAGSPEYARMLEQLSHLYKIKDPKSENKTTLKDWIPLIGSIGGILVIIAYEQYGHPLTSKAVSFIRKA